MIYLAYKITFSLVGSLLPTQQSFTSSATYLSADQKTVNEDNNNDDDQSEEEDVHLCGGCKQQFTSYYVFKKHKKTCQSRKSKQKIIATDSNPNLEATAISLLANQFSNNLDSNRKDKFRKEFIIFIIIKIKIVKNNSNSSIRNYPLD